MHSLYAIPGVPKSARYYPGTIEHIYTTVLSYLEESNFTLIAHRRVRSNWLVALHHPATLCVRVDLLLLLTAFVSSCAYTISQAFAICKACMNGVKIPLVGTQAQKLGGDEGARTPDLDSAIVALSQLSYIP